MQQKLTRLHSSSSSSSLSWESGSHDVSSLPDLPAPELVRMIDDLIENELKGMNPTNLLSTNSKPISSDDNMRNYTSSSQQPTPSLPSVTMTTTATSTTTGAPTFTTTVPTDPFNRDACKSDKGNHEVVLPDNVQHWPDRFDEKESDTHSFMPSQQQQEQHQNYHQQQQRKRQQQLQMTPQKLDILSSFDAHDDGNAAEPFMFKLSRPRMSHRPTGDCHRSSSLTLTGDRKEKGKENIGRLAQKSVALSHSDNDSYAILNTSASSASHIQRSDDSFSCGNQETSLQLQGGPVDSAFQSDGDRYNYSHGCSFMENSANLENPHRREFSSNATFTSTPKVDSSSAVELKVELEELSVHCSDNSHSLNCDSRIDRNKDECFSAQNDEMC